MSVSSFAQDGQNLQSGYEAPGASKGLEFFEERTPESIGKEASRIALVLLEAKDCPSGKMPAWRQVQSRALHILNVSSS